MTDEQYSWSRKPAWNQISSKPRPKPYGLKSNLDLLQSNRIRMVEKYGEEGSRGLVHGPAYESADVPDDYFVDGFSTQLAIATLQDHLKKKPNQPLFLALGFTKPHLNFVAPKKYWDLYDREEIKIATQVDQPNGGAATGLHASFELRTRHGIPKSGPIGEELAKTLLHGYYACVSYVDAQIGLSCDFDFFSIIQIPVLFRSYKIEMWFCETKGKKKRLVRFLFQMVLQGRNSKLSAESIYKIIIRNICTFISWSMNQSP
jgi:hypothetical protein